MLSTRFSVAFVSTRVVVTLFCIVVCVPQDGDELDLDSFNPAPAARKPVRR